jgi:hypothetical protein
MQRHIARRSGDDVGRDAEIGMRAVPKRSTLRQHPSRVVGRRPKTAAEGNADPTTTRPATEHNNGRLSGLDAAASQESEQQSNADRQRAKTKNERGETRDGRKGPEARPRDET